MANLTRILIDAEQIHRTVFIRHHFSVQNNEPTFIFDILTGKRNDDDPLGNRGGKGLSSLVSACSLEAETTKR